MEQDKDWLKTKIQIFHQFAKTRRRKARIMVLPPEYSVDLTVYEDSHPPQPYKDCKFRIEPDTFQIVFVLEIEKIGFRLTREKNLPVPLNDPKISLYKPGERTILIRGENEKYLMRYRGGGPGSSAVADCARIYLRLKALNELPPRPEPGPLPGTPESPSLSSLSLANNSSGLQSLEADQIDLAPSALEYDQDIVGGNFAEFMEVAQKIGGEVAEHAALVRDAFDVQKKFLATATRFAKPGAVEFQNLLAGTTNAIESIQKFRDVRRSSLVFNHLSAISASIPALAWVTISPAPGLYVEDMKDMIMIYINRVLTDFKDKPGHADWVRTWVGTLTNLQAYINKNHCTGLVWGKLPYSAENVPSPPAGVHVEGASSLLAQFIQMSTGLSASGGGSAAGSSECGGTATETKGSSGSSAPKPELLLKVKGSYKEASASGSKPSGAAIQPHDLEKTPSNMKPAANTVDPALNSEFIRRITTCPKTIQKLAPLMPQFGGPEVSTSDSAKSSNSSHKEVEDTLLCPQLQGALTSFCAAFPKGQLGPLISQFEMGQDAVDAAKNGNLEAFLNAIQKDVSALPIDTPKGEADQGIKIGELTENQGMSQIIVLGAMSQKVL